MPTFIKKYADNNVFIIYFQVENGNKNGQMTTFNPLFKQK
jgi:hypothetical protein